jgi:hypothetical protein
MRSQSQCRNRADGECELLDTGIFNEDRYFDVFVEYDKQTAQDILIEITICNRGPDQAALQVLLTLWFRNSWTRWPNTPKPSLTQVAVQGSARVVVASHIELGERFLNLILHNACNNNAVDTFTNK